VDRSCCAFQGQGHESQENIKEGPQEILVDQEKIEARVADLKHARAALKIAIVKVKGKAWEELIFTLNEDLWE